MGGNQSIKVEELEENEINEINEINKELEEHEEILKRLEEIERRIKEIGLDRDEFRNLLREEKIDFDDADSLEVLARVNAFINSREEDLRGIVEVKEELKNLLKKEGVTETDVDVYLKTMGFDIDNIPLDRDARNRMLDTIKNYEIPEVRFEINAATLRKLARAVLWIAQESVVNFDERGMRILAIDPANIVMVAVEASNDFFDFYSGTNRIIGIEWEKVLNCLKLESGVVEIQIANHFVIKTDSRTVKLSLIDPATLKNPQKIPELKIDAEIFVSEFHKIVNAHQSVGECMEIIAGSNGAILRTKNNDGDVIEDYAECYTEQNVVARYSIDYLKSIASSLRRFTDKITIRFSENHPAVFEYEDEDEEMSLKYILAPRIEC